MHILQRKANFSYNLADGRQNEQVMMRYEPAQDPSVQAFFNAVVEQIGGSSLEEILSLRADPVQKEDGSFVTKGDLLVQRMIVELAEKHFHQPVLISEEMPVIPGVTDTDRMILVVDPIDGTENYTSGLAEWGVSIACYQRETHVGSLIGAPELRRWLRTGERITRHRSRIRGLSSSLSKDQIGAMATSPEYRILGCCVVNMMAVVTGSFISFENPRGARTWDILAGLNLALEHGLSVTVNEEPYEGGFLDPSERFRFRIEYSATEKTRPNGLT